MRSERFPLWCLALLLGCWGDAPGTTASTGNTTTEIQALQPEDPEDVFSQEQWDVHVARISKDLGPGALEPLEPGFPTHSAYIPLDPDLLARVTFLGVPAADLDRLMRVRAPRFRDGQPYGGAGYVMWPRVEEDCDLVLILRWEINADLVPVVTSEKLDKRCRDPGFQVMRKKVLLRAAPIDALP